MNKTDSDKRYQVRCQRCKRVCGVDRNGRKHKCKCGKVVTCR